MASRLRKAAKVVGLAAVGVAGGVATVTLIYTNSKSQVTPPPPPFLVAVCLHRQREGTEYM